jgi:hypothetical protein
LLISHERFTNNNYSGINVLATQRRGRRREQDDTRKEEYFDKGKKIGRIVLFFFDADSRLEGGG